MKRISSRRAARLSVLTASVCLLAALCLLAGCTWTAEDAKSALTDVPTVSADEEAEEVTEAPEQSAEVPLTIDELPENDPGMLPEDELPEVTEDPTEDAAAEASEEPTEEEPEELPEEKPEEKDAEPEKMPEDPVEASADKAPEAAPEADTHGIREAEGVTPAVLPAGPEAVVNTPVKAEEKDYVLNTNTDKFHRPSCSSVGDIKPKNRVDTHASRDDIIARGFVPCKLCNP